MLCGTKERWCFPVEVLIFRGGEERAVCGWTVILAKHSPEIQHVRDTEDRKLQLR